MESPFSLKRMALSLAHMNRLVASLPDEETLYDEIVRIVVDECGLSHAMIGVPDSLGWIHARSAHGKSRDDGFTAKISVNDDRPEGNGLIGRAFRASSPIVENRLPDLDEKPIDCPVLEGVVPGSSAVFPFYRGGSVHGCLSLLRSR